MSETKSLWETRLQEATVHLEPGVTVEACAKRYDVVGAGDLKQLTNVALQIAFDAGHDTIALDDLDAVAVQLEVIA
jgi:hypothetical protein